MIGLLQMKSEVTVLIENEIAFKLKSCIFFSSDTKYIIPIPILWFSETNQVSFNSIQF